MAPLHTPDKRLTVVAFLLLHQEDHLKIPFVESRKKPGKWGPVQGGIKERERVTGAIRIWGDKDGRRRRSKDDLRILAAMLREVRGEIGLGVEAFRQVPMAYLLPHFEALRIEGDVRVYHPVVAQLRGKLGEIRLCSNEIQGFHLVGDLSTAALLMGEQTSVKKKQHILRILADLGLA